MLHSQERQSVWIYYAALLFVVVFWGVSSVIYRYFYRYYSAAVLTTVMTFFSAVFFWILARKKLTEINKKFLKTALPICLLNAFANVLQRIGLQYTTPANYAFFEHLSCITVPVTVFLLVRKKPSLTQSIAGVCCLAGCFILCGVRLTPGSNLIGIGDALCILAGILMGVCVATIGVYTKDMDAVLFMVVYMTCYFAVSLLLAVGLHNIQVDGVSLEPAVITWKLPLLLAVSVFGLVDVALCWFLRTEAIRHINPVTVATISPCSAVITGAASVWAGIDRLTPNLLIGGGIVFLSVIVPELIKALSIRKKNKEAVMNNKHLQEAKTIYPWLKDIFCRLHQNPELGRQEYKTQALVLDELKKMGIAGQPIADTGVVATIYGGKPGKTIAFRGDMDALPIQEETELPYKSKVPGVMHACGHDLHTTLLLGVAKWFSHHKDEMRGNIKLLFQPNEEGDGGAERMVKAGCMENPKVDAVFFGHSVTIPLGTVTVRDGSMSAASNPFSVTFRGKGTHGAQPQNGTDVIVAACQAVSALQTVCSRRTAPTDAVLLTVGAIHAGVEGNGSIMPETARIDGILRTQTPEIRKRAKADFHQIINGIAEAMGVKAEIDMRDGYTASINDPAMTQLMRSAAAKLFGSENVQTNPAGMGAEDFGYFLEQAPGCYYRFGVGDPKAEKYYPLHNSKFQLDPEALIYGTALYTQIAEDFLQQD